RHDDAVLEPNLAHELGRLDVQDAGLAIGDEVLHHVAKRHRGDLSLEAHVLSANTLAEDYDGDRERSNHRTAISERMGTRPRQAGVTAPADDEAPRRTRREWIAGPSPRWPVALRRALAQGVAKAPPPIGIRRRSGRTERARSPSRPSRRRTPCRSRSRSFPRKPSPFAVGASSSPRPGSDRRRLDPTSTPSSAPATSRSRGSAIPRTLSAIRTTEASGSAITMSEASTSGASTRAPDASFKRRPRSSRRRAPRSPFGSPSRGARPTAASFFANRDFSPPSTFSGTSSRSRSRSSFRLRARSPCRSA